MVEMKGSMMYAEKRCSSLTTLGLSASTSIIRLCVRTATPMTRLCAAQTQDGEDVAVWLDGRDPNHGLLDAI